VGSNAAKTPQPRQQLEMTPSAKPQQQTPVASNAEYVYHLGRVRSEVTEVN